MVPSSSEGMTEGHPVKPGMSASALTDDQLRRLLVKERIKEQIRGRLFRQQRDLLLDPSRFKAALCSRRAGKTVADAHYALHELIDCGPKDYVILSSDHYEKAKRLFWPDISALLTELRIPEQLGWKVLEGRGEIETPEGGRLVCMGLNDMRKVSKPRGLRAKLFIIDEVQEFEELLTQLWRDVVAPLLTEADGTLLVTGTPGQVLAGSWYEISTGNVSRGAGDRPSEGNSFKRFTWTLLDNPHFEKVAGVSPQKALDDTMRLRGVDISDPAIQREYMGRWAADGSNLVHPYAKSVPVPEGWDIDNEDWCESNLVTTGAIDFGWTDATGVVVMATRRGETRRYVVHAKKQPRLKIEEIIDEIRQPMLRWCPQEFVGDHNDQRAIAAFNDDHAEEVGCFVELADKLDKDQTIAEMNDAMQRGELLFIEGYGDAVLQETGEWAYKDDLRKHTKGEDHLCDALRYAFKAHPRATDAPPPALTQWEKDRDKRNAEARRRRQDDEADAAW